MDELLLKAAKIKMQEEGHDCGTCSLTEECVFLFIVNNPEADDLEILAKLSYSIYVSMTRMSNEMGLMTLLSERMCDGRLADTICRVNIAMAVVCLCMSELKEVILEKEGR